MIPAILKSNTKMTAFPFCTPYLRHVFVVFILIASFILVHFAFNFKKFTMDTSGLVSASLRRFINHTEGNRITYIIIPFHHNETDFLLYETVIQSLNKFYKNHPIKVMVIQSSDELESRKWFLYNVGLLESLKDTKAKCIVSYDLNIALPENITLSECDVPTRVCTLFQCSEAKTMSSLEIIQASTFHWKMINGYTKITSHSEDITEDLLLRFNASNTGLKTLLHTSCNCVDKSIYEGEKKQMSYEYRALATHELNSTGLNSSRYYKTNENIDQFGSKWITAKDISVISPSEISLFKRTLYTSPIVVQKYRFIFFWSEKSGCTYWKRVLQYIQGIDIVLSIDNAHFNNGLLKLENFKDTEVQEMIYDDSWLKVAFVREPRERILSAYLDKGSSKEYLCGNTITSFSEFIKLIRTCQNYHWESQVRVPKYHYKRMLIGYMSEVSSFTENLLRKVGAWDENFQKWMYSQNNTDSTRHHAKNAKEKLLLYYNRTLEDAIFEIYADDYEVFDFNKEYISRN